MRNKGMIARKTSGGTPFRANSGHAAAVYSKYGDTSRTWQGKNGCERRFDGGGVDEEEDASPDRRPHTLLHSIRRLTDFAQLRKTRAPIPSAHPIFGQRMKHNKRNFIMRTINEP